MCVDQKKKSLLIYIYICFRTLSKRYAHFVQHNSIYLFILLKMNFLLPTQTTIMEENNCSLFEIPNFHSSETM